MQHWKTMFVLSNHAKNTKTKIQEKAKQIGNFRFSYAMPIILHIVGPMQVNINSAYFK